MKTAAEIIRKTGKFPEEWYDKRLDFDYNKKLDFDFVAPRSDFIDFDLQKATHVYVGKVNRRLGARVIYIAASGKVIRVINWLTLQASTFNHILILEEPEEDYEYERLL